jgi:hypothetical protein
MELSRRDALAALAALGTAGSTAGCALGPPEKDDGDVLAAYLVVAETVYPSEVDGIEPFVESFLPPRLDREEHGDRMTGTVHELDELAREWYDTSVSELSSAECDQLLREVGAETADEDPEGSLAERVRFYVVNELLLGLYASPTGGGLVGIENPQGYAGGTDSYQRGPQR